MTRVEPATTETDGTGLASATTHCAACEAVVTMLAAVPGLKPSVYLERGGKLRCQAAATYTHVFDGMPPTAGVIGRTFSTGEPAIVRDTASDPDYLPITDGVIEQFAFPVRSFGEVIGVVNVESRQPVDDAGIEAARAAAEALSARAQALGGSLPSTPAQALLRHALRLTEERDRGRLHRELLHAAREITGMDSAALYDVGLDGRVTMLDADGPLAGPIREAEPELAELACLVGSGSSWVTVGREGPHDVAVLAGLRAHGLRSAVVLRKRVDPLRALLVAGTEAREVSTEVVELLELLCVLACSVGRSCDLLAHLERQAATDPLTGLGHHAAFYDRLATARADAVAAVVMLDLDAFKTVNDTLGHAAGDELLRVVGHTLRSELRASDELFRVGGDEFAVLMPAVEAVDVERMTRRIRTAIGAKGATTVSIGVAMTDPREPLPEAARRADRALYEAKAAGRDRTEVAAPPH